MTRMTDFQLLSFAKMCQLNLISNRLGISPRFGVLMLERCHHGWHSLHGIAVDIAARCCHIQWQTGSREESKSSFRQACLGSSSLPWSETDQRHLRDDGIGPQSS